MENDTVSHNLSTTSMNPHENCHSWYASGDGSSVLFLLQSILLDFVGGIISCSYLYKFYQGIEISHPIYAILFSNIIFSSAISFLSFILVLAMLTGFMSCIIAMNLNGFGCFIVILLNIISWLSIALIRHYLMTTDESNIMDLQKLQKIASTSTWIAFVTAVSIRTAFFFLPIPYLNVLPLNLMVVVSFYAFFLGSFCIVSYHTDNVLEAKLHKKINKELDTSETPAPMDGTIISSKQIESNIRNYGGVYIGDEDINVYDYQSPDASNPSSHSTQNDNQKQTGVKNYNEKSNNSQDIFIIHHRSETDDDDNIQSRVSNDHYIDVILPHQVEKANEERNSKVVVNIDSICNDNRGDITFQTEFYGSTSEGCRIKNDMSGTQAVQTINGDDPNRIDILNESPINDSKNIGVPECFPEPFEEGARNETQHSNDDKLYKDTKEHKSIMKAVTFNSICASVFISILIIVGVISHYPNIYVIIIFNGIVKLQRTFGMLIASVYCFEVVHHLFCETFYNMRDEFEQFYSRIV